MQRIISTAGLTVDAKRSSLAPSAVDEVVFDRENLHLLTIALIENMRHDAIDWGRTI